jgi:hypothetical protein
MSRESDRPHKSEGGKTQMTATKGHLSYRFWERCASTAVRPTQNIFCFPMSRQPLGGLGRLIVRGFTIILRHTTVGRTPLDEGPARRRDLYLTTHNSHNRQTSMPPAGFEPIILVCERPQTHALDRTVTEIGRHAKHYLYDIHISSAGRIVLVH